MKSIHVACLLLASLCGGAVAALGCSSGDGGGPSPDGGGSGTTQDTGGGTCTLATSCLGAFFGACFDPSGSCTASGTAINYSSGAKLTKEGTKWTATGSAGPTSTPCYTVDEVSGTYTFHAGTQTLTLTYAGNQARFVCPDGSIVNFTDSSFGNSECARFVPNGCAKK